VVVAGVASRNQDGRSALAFFFSLVCIRLVRPPLPVESHADLFLRVEAFVVLVLRRLFLPWAAASVVTSLGCSPLGMASPLSSTAAVCADRGVLALVTVLIVLLLLANVASSCAMELVILDVNALSSNPLAASHGRVQALTVFLKTTAAILLGGGQTSLGRVAMALVGLCLGSSLAAAHMLRAPYAQRAVNALFFAAGCATAWAAATGLLPLLGGSIGVTAPVTFGTGLVFFWSFFWLYSWFSQLSDVIIADGATSLSVWHAIMWTRDKLRHAQLLRKLETSQGLSREGRKAALLGTLEVGSKAKISAIEMLMSLAGAEEPTGSSQASVTAAAALRDAPDRVLSHAELAEREALLGIAFLETEHSFHAFAQLSMAQFWDVLFSRSRFKERLCLSTAKSLSSSWDVVFLAKSAQECLQRADSLSSTAQASSSASRDISARVHFDHVMDRAIEQMALAYHLQSGVMKLVAAGEYDVSSLHFQEALQIGRALKEARLAVEELLEAGIESADALALATEFYSYLGGSDKTATELSFRLGRLLEQRKRLTERKVPHVAFGTQCEDISPTDERHCVFTISTDRLRLGEITAFNASASLTFGRRDFLGQNISSIIPAPISTVHDRFLQRFLRTGTARLLDATRFLIAKHSDGSIFPIRFRLFETPPSESDVRPQLTGLCSAVNSDEGFLIVGDDSLDFAVTSACRRTCTFLGKSPDTIESSLLAGSSLFPELFGAVREAEERPGLSRVGSRPKSQWNPSQPADRGSVMQRDRGKRALEGVPPWVQRMPSKLFQSFLKPTRVSMFRPSTHTGVQHGAAPRSLDDSLFESLLVPDQPSARSGQSDPSSPPLPVTVRCYATPKPFPSDPAAVVVSWTRRDGGKWGPLNRYSDAGHGPEELVRHKAPPVDPSHLVAASLSRRGSLGVGGTTKPAVGDEVGSISSRSSAGSKRLVRHRLDAITQMHSKPLTWLRLSLVWASVVFLIAGILTLTFVEQSVERAVVFETAMEGALTLVRELDVMSLSIHAVASDVEGLDGPCSHRAENSTALAGALGSRPFDYCKWPTSSFAADVWFVKHGAELMRSDLSILWPSIASTDLDTYEMLSALNTVCSYPQPLAGLRDPGSFLMTVPSFALHGWLRQEAFVQHKSVADHVAHPLKDMPFSWTPACHGSGQSVFDAMNSLVGATERLRDANSSTWTTTREDVRYFVQNAEIVGADALNSTVDRLVALAATDLEDTIDIKLLFVFLVVCCFVLVQLAVGLGCAHRLQRDQQVVLSVLFSTPRAIAVELGSMSLQRWKRLRAKAALIESTKSREHSIEGYSPSHALPVTADDTDGAPEFSPDHASDPATRPDGITVSRASLKLKDLHAMGSSHFVLQASTKVSAAKRAIRATGRRCFSLRLGTTVALPSLIIVLWIAVIAVLNSEGIRNIVNRLQRTYQALELSTWIMRHSHTAGWAAFDPTFQVHTPEGDLARSAALLRMENERIAIERRLAMLLHGGSSPLVDFIVEHGTGSVLSVLAPLGPIPALSQSSIVFRSVTADVCPEIVAAASHSYFNTEGRRLITEESCAAAHDGVFKRGLASAISRFLARSKSLSLSLERLWAERASVRQLGASANSTLHLTALETAVFSLGGSVLQLANPWLRLATRDVGHSLAELARQEGDASWTVIRDVTVAFALTFVLVTIFLPGVLLSDTEQATLAARKLLNLLPDSVVLDEHMMAAVDEALDKLGLAL
jgi:hypothetical protein